MSNNPHSGSAANVTLTEEKRQMQGLIGALGAFICWGVFPLYFKMLDGIPVLEILAHRIVWSLVLVGFIIFFTHRFRKVLETLSDPRTLMLFFGSTLMIAINWTVFVWAVTSGRVLEASLGYYINPLVNVMLGMLFLGERMNKAQTTAILLAVAAVLLLSFKLGDVPWVSLAMAFSFGFYGLLRKKAPTESAVGLAVETAILTPVCIAYIAYLAITGTGGAGGAFYDFSTNMLLLGLGAVTALPLIMFSFGAQRLRLSTVGVIQYIAPTLHAILAVYVFGETFSQDRLIAFGLIWIGLLIYTVDGFRGRGKAK